MREVDVLRTERIEVLQERPEDGNAQLQNEVKAL